QFQTLGLKLIQRLAAGVGGQRRLSLSRRFSHRLRLDFNLGFVRIGVVRRHLNLRHRPRRLVPNSAPDHSVLLHLRNLCRRLPFPLLPCPLPQPVPFALLRRLRLFLLRRRHRCPIQRHVQLAGSRRRRKLRRQVAEVRVKFRLPIGGRHLEGVGRGRPALFQG